MKLAYWELSDVIWTDNGKLNSIIIENQSFMCRFVSDIYNQIDGNNGKIILSMNDAPITFDKNSEIIDRFINFDMNSKTVLSKLCSKIEDNALSSENYQRSIEILNTIEAYLADMSFDYSCSISFLKLSLSSLIKSSGLVIESDGSITEKIADYMELVTELDRRKLFITLNMRSFVGDDEMNLFSDTVISHGYDILMIESCAYPMIKNECRVIIDSDLCEIRYC